MRNPDDLNDVDDGFQQMIQTRSIPKPKNYDDFALSNLFGASKSKVLQPVSAEPLQTLHPLAADPLRSGRHDRKNRRTQSNFELQQLSTSQVQPNNGINFFGETP